MDIRTKKNLQRQGANQLDLPETWFTDRGRSADHEYANIEKSLLIAFEIAKAMRKDTFNPRRADARRRTRRAGGRLNAPV